MVNNLKKNGAYLDFLNPKRPTAYGTKGAVTSPHYLATEVGKDILQKGGHAVEAAIAMNATLGVVYPHMGGIGGDLMALVYDVHDGEVIEMNGSGIAGEKASIEAYEDLGYKEDIPSRGPLSAITVPGTVNAWWRLHEKYGKLSWKDLFVGAIEYAKAGFPISGKLAGYIFESKDLLEKNDEAYRHFLPNGEVPMEGQLFKQPDLASSLTLIAEQGPEAFYSGEITDKIVSDLKAHNGLLTRKDFQVQQSEWKKPISTDYRGYDIIQTRPNSQGAASLIIMNILENFDLQDIGDNTPEYYHLMAEAAKLAFLYRDRWITDERSMDIDLAAFQSNRVGEQLASRITLEGILEIEAERKQLPSFKRGGDTTFMAAVDNEGNAVSLIQSIYHEFGSGFMPKETGFLLHNRGESFELRPEHPNNLVPGKQPFHTIIPAMMMKDSKPVMCYGSMGGEGQPQTQAAIVTRVVDFGYSIQAAIEAPRWLHGRTWGDDSDSLTVEGRIPDGVIRELELRGQEIERAADWDDELGHAQGITINPETGVLGAGADPRGDGIGLSW